MYLFFSAGCKARITLNENNDLVSYSWSQPRNPSCWNPRPRSQARLEEESSYFRPPHQVSCRRRLPSSVWSHQVKPPRRHPLAHSPILEPGWRVAPRIPYHDTMLPPYHFEVPGCPEEVAQPHRRESCSAPLETAAPEESQEVDRLRRIVSDYVDFVYMS